MTSAKHKKYTARQVVRALAAAAEKRGDQYVDASHSHYDFTHRRPGCLVGQMFYDMGIPLSKLRYMSGSLSTIETQVGLNEFGIDFTGPARDILVKAQRLNDGGYTWGEVIKKCESMLPPLKIKQKAAVAANKKKIAVDQHDADSITALTDADAMESTPALVS